MKRWIEDDFVKAEAAREVLNALRPPEWFVSSVKSRSAEALRDEAPFVSLRTAERLIERAQAMSISGAYQSLRGYAQSFIASLEDDAWGGRYR